MGNNLPIAKIQSFDFDFDFFFFFHFLKVVAGDLDKIVLILWTLVHLVVYLGEQAKAAMFHAVANLSLFSFILA